MIELGGGVAFIIICIALFIQKRRQEEISVSPQSQLEPRLVPGYSEPEPASTPTSGGAVNKANTFKYSINSITIN